MPPLSETMIQSPFHHSHGSSSLSHSGSGSQVGNGNDPGSYSSSQSQTQTQSQSHSGRSKHNSQQQNSPSNSNNAQMYVQPPHMMGGGHPYMGHAPHMQHSPFSMQQQQPPQTMSSPHHPQQPIPHPHGYPMPPHNIYHHGGYPQHPYHQMHLGHTAGHFSPQNAFPMTQGRNGNDISSPKMNDKEFNDTEYPNKPQAATAISKKSTKDSFSVTVDSDSALNVEPMKSDFYYFLNETKELIMMEAIKQVKECCDNNLVQDLQGNLAKLDMENGDPHPYLLFSNINERLIRKWEELPQTNRSTYLVKEEEDRKRFMNAEEVASRHCATLTARARSPQPFTPKNRDKGKTSENKSVEKEKRETRQGIPNSLNRMLQSEGEKTDFEAKAKDLKTRLSSELVDEHCKLTGSNESPVKRIKSDPLAQVKQLYGDFFFVHEKHAGCTRQELLQLAENVPIQVNDQTTDRERDLKIFQEERDKFHAQAEICAKKDETKTMNTIDGTENNKASSHMFDDGEDEFDDCEEPMEIGMLLDRRIRQVRGKKMKEYLVRWKGHDKESDSWEPFKNVEHCEEMWKQIDEKKKVEKEKAMKKY